MKLYIEEVDGQWDLCSDSDDGKTVDVHESFATKDDAQAALKAESVPMESEAHYQAQYAYACGYYE